MTIQQFKTTLFGTKKRTIISAIGILVLVLVFGKALPGLIMLLAIGYGIYRWLVRPRPATPYMPNNALTANQPQAFTTYQPQQITVPVTTTNVINVVHTVQEAPQVRSHARQKHTATQIVVRTYKSPKAYAKDAAKMGKQGYTVTANATPQMKKGFIRVWFFGGFRERPGHITVTYTR